MNLSSSSSSSISFCILSDSATYSTFLSNSHVCFVCPILKRMFVKSNCSYCTNISFIFLLFGFHNLFDGKLFRQPHRLCQRRQGLAADHIALSTDPLRLHRSRQAEF
nr:MAG TPA: hypothetical protein [Caudoviricetes sp.]